MSGPLGIRTKSRCSWLSPRSLILLSTTGSERLAEREGPFKLGADVKGDGLAASRVNLHLACARVSDLVRMAARNFAICGAFGTSLRRSCLLFRHPERQSTDAAAYLPSGRIGG
jgi:hypothetical protein